MENDQTTIDDKLPSNLRKESNGEYTATGNISGYHFEPGYLFVQLTGNKGGANFFAIREEPGYIQNEAIRADMAAMVIALEHAAKYDQSFYKCEITGELLPGDWTASQHYLKGMRGLRIHRFQII